HGRWGQVATASDAPDDVGGPVSAAAVDGGFVYRSQSFGVCSYTFTTATATCRRFDSPLPAFSPLVEGGDGGAYLWGGRRVTDGSTDPSVSPDAATGMRFQLP
ncbi:MAG: hypothetical protein WAK18_11020, partial [Nocardioidaceae bacterium]